MLNTERPAAGFSLTKMDPDKTEGQTTPLTANKHPVIKKSKINMITIIDVFYINIIIITKIIITSSPTAMSPDLSAAPPCITRAIRIRPVLSSA